MKRFWERAEAAAEEGAWVIRLDGRPMRIPGGATLRLGQAALAEAIAAEWQGAGVRGAEIGWDMVPLTRLAGTAQDRIAPDPAPVAEALARYAETDVLCYRAEHPLPLVTRQAREWQPWLDWLEARHGARLLPIEGISHRPQDPASVARVRAALLAQSPGVLAGLGIAIPALGSVVLGLAMAEGALDPDRATAIASLDELYQVEHWGEDFWAAKRRQDAGRDVATAARFIELARGDASTATGR